MAAETKTEVKVVKVDANEKLKLEIEQLKIDAEKSKLIAEKLKLEQTIKTNTATIDNAKQTIETHPEATDYDKLPKRKSYRGSMYGGKDNE